MIGICALKLCFRDRLIHKAHADRLGPIYYMVIGNNQKLCIRFGNNYPGTASLALLLISGIISRLFSMKASQNMSKMIIMTLGL